MVLILLHYLTENKEFSEEMVRGHNALRQCHGCGELSPADDLSKDAQMWADIIAEKGFLQYSELPGMESPHQGRADVGRYHSREGLPAV